MWDFRNSILSCFLFHFDVFESGACALAALAALQCLPLFARNSLLDKDQLSEILFLFSHALLGVYIFSLSQDLMTAFIGLELTSLALYLLIGMAPKETLPLEASIKYFVLSAFAGILFLYGLSFIFGLSGDLTVSGLAASGHQFHRFFFLGLAFLLAGLLFKMSVFPFQFWLPDVYQGAITPVTSFMATGFKAAVILFVGRVFLPVFSGEKLEMLLMGFAVLSVLTALFGNILALRQTNLKRLVAFSSLGHSGYLLMALTGLFSIQKADFFPLFYYLLAYVFMTGGALAVIQCLEEKTPQPTLKDLEGLFKTNPWIALSLTLFLLGLAGIPPLFGFFAKVALFQPVIAAGLWWVLFWGLVASGIGLYYYVKTRGVYVSGPSAEACYLFLEHESAVCLFHHWSFAGRCLFGLVLRHGFKKLLTILMIVFFPVSCWLKFFKLSCMALKRPGIPSPVFALIKTPGLKSESLFSEAARRSILLKT